MIARILGYEHLMPCVIMVLYSLTMMSYAAKADWWRVMYWACALGITVSATFGLKSH